MDTSSTCRAPDDSTSCNKPFSRSLFSATFNALAASHTLGTRSTTTNAAATNARDANPDARPVEVPIAMTDLMRMQYGRSEKDSRENK